MDHASRRTYNAGARIYAEFGACTRVLDSASGSRSVPLFLPRSGDRPYALRRSALERSCDRPLRTPLDDPPSGLYWMLSNLATNSQNLVPWDPEATGKRSGVLGDERRWLFLHYSLDCLNWISAGCVARWPTDLRRSFMYPSAVADGEDLVLLSRTSRDSGNHHDADLCTVHRVRQFRSMAHNLAQGHSLLGFRHSNPSQLR